MPAVKDVGEPCAGEPHARNRREGAGNGAVIRHRASSLPNHSRVAAVGAYVMTFPTEGVL